MRRTIALTEKTYDDLRGALSQQLESSGLLIGTAIADEHLTFLTNHVRWMADHAYTHRAPDELRLPSEAWAPAYREIAAEGGVAAFVHTHPGMSAAHSRRDDEVDRALAPAIRRLTGADLVSVVVGGTPRAPELRARQVSADGQTTPIDTVRVVGDRLRLLRRDHADLEDRLHDRQIRAFGPDGQLVLAGLRAGVIGLGGTGSPLIEMLLRLGVGQIIGIDDDVVTESTPSRGAFYSPRHLGDAKTEVMEGLADHLDMAPRLTVVTGNVTEEAVAQSLRHCDIIFSCTDGHSGRLPANRMPYWNLTPMIDVGVRIDHRDGASREARPRSPDLSITGRRTWVSPGAACLLCRDRINPELAQAEQLSPEERREQAGQGYTPDLDTPAPAVVAYTNMMASYAADEMLRRLFGFGELGATESIHRIDRRDVRLNASRPRAGCFCADDERWGQGGRGPALGLLWTS